MNRASVDSVLKHSKFVGTSLKVNFDELNFEDQDDPSSLCLRILQESLDIVLSQYSAVSSAAVKMSVGWTLDNQCHLGKPCYSRITFKDIRPGLPGKNNAQR